MSEPSFTAASMVRQSAANAGGELAIAPILPPPRCTMTVRVATPGAGSADLTFIDALQKMHSHMVGFFPRKQMQDYVEGGHVLIAEEIGIKASGHHGNKGSDPTMPSLLAMSSPRINTSSAMMWGLCIN